MAGETSHSNREDDGGDPDVVPRSAPLNDGPSDTKAEGASLADQPEGMWHDLSDVVRHAERQWPREPPPSVEALIGENATASKVLGRFVVLHEVGRGGCGVVYKARDPEYERIVALKIPRSDFGASDDAFERFQREAKIVATLDHAGIVPVYEAGQHEGVSYIVSQFCHGPDLGKWLRGNSEGLSPRQSARLVADLAEALDYAHRRGVVHRDVKPGNVLLAPLESENVVEAGDDPQVLPFHPRLTDFGLAHMQSAEWSQTRTSLIIGTPLYMAPECFTKDRGKWGATGDVYALGALLYELLTGAPPIEGEGFGELLDRIKHHQPKMPHEIRDDIPPDLSIVCTKCLAKDPVDRYATAGELADDLHRFLREEPILARIPNLWDRFTKWCQQPRRIKAAGIYTCWFHLLTMAWLLASLSVAGVFELIPRDQLQKNAFDLLLAGLTMHFPKAWLGWQVVRGRRWAFWPSTVTSFICLGVFVVSVTATSLFFEFNHPTVLSKITSFTMMIAASLVETVAYLVAVPAFLDARRSSDRS